MATNPPLRMTGARVFEIDNAALPQTLVVDAGTGSVTVEVQIDAGTDAYILSDTFTITDVYKVEANGCKIRVTATGDASFAFIRP